MLDFAKWIAVGAALMLAVAPARADVVYSNFDPNATATGGIELKFDGNVSFQFTATNSGTVTGWEGLMSRYAWRTWGCDPHTPCAATSLFVVELFDSNNTLISSGTNPPDANPPGDPSYALWDVPMSSVDILAGQTYTIELATGPTDAVIWRGATSGYTTFGGTFNSYNGTNVVGGYPNAFELVGTAATDTPEPASMAILATALAGIGAIRRRRAA